MIVQFSSRHGFVVVSVWTDERLSSLFRRILLQPAETDIRALFDLLRRALTALARELLAADGAGS